MRSIRLAAVSFGIAVLCSTAPTPDRALHAEGASSASAAPPIARAVSTTLVEHGRPRTDNYDWLPGEIDSEGDAGAVRTHLPAIDPIIGIAGGERCDVQHDFLGRLRATKTDDRELLFKVDMGAGHSGPAGRLGSIEETAAITAWLVS